MIQTSPKDSSIETSVCSAAQGFLETSLEFSRRLEGGYEAIVLRAECSQGSVVIHVSPVWRTRAELEWSYCVARVAQRYVPEIVLPIQRENQSVFEWNSRMVAVFPFIEGSALERENLELRIQAAKCLARIHRALLNWQGGDRPKSSNNGGLYEVTDLNDAALDVWWKSINDSANRLLTSATHGDYYRNNLLCTGDRVVGIIDWHDALVRPLALELAGAIFEFSRDDQHFFQIDRAEDFIAGYITAGGPVPRSELELLVPLIRLWIRSDVMASLRFGATVGDEYVDKQIRAFQSWKGVQWVPRA
jgi:Ser/Thr protein kinase RdoA (MazF antagonist)